MMLKISKPYQRRLTEKGKKKFGLQMIKPKEATHSHSTIQGLDTPGPLKKMVWAPPQNR